MRSYASSLNSLEISGGSVFIFSNIKFLSSTKKGGTPISISYISTPNKYQSTALPWPVFSSISGAKYAADPQNEFAKNGS